MKFKPFLEELLKRVVAPLNLQICDCDKELYELQEKSENLLIKIRGAFADATAKLLSFEQTAQDQSSQNSLIPFQRQKTREVLVKTDEGKGDFYILKTNPEYDSPITAIHHVKNNCACFKFETKDDGEAVKNWNPLLVRLAINQ